MGESFSVLSDPAGAVGYMFALVLEFSNIPEDRYLGM